VLNIDKAKNLNAFISLTSAAMAGKTEPADVVTFALADNICTDELKTTCASPMLKDYQPPFGSSAAQRLTAKGALLVGKTNMDEFGVGAWGKSSYFGAVKNPWNEKHTAGSGAAAAVASGAVSLALAADRWGELRQAAAYCGVIGLKPTYGRVSRSGLIDCAPSLEQLGIIARNTVDLAVALEAVSGSDPQDPTSFQGDVPPYTDLLQEKVGTIKVAVPGDWADMPYLTKEMKEAFADSINSLNNTFFQVETVALPYLQHSLLTAVIIGAVEAFSNMSNFDGVRFGMRGRGKHLQEMYRLTRTEGFSSEIKQLLTFGALISSGKYYNDYFLKAQKMRTLIKKEFEQCLEQYDLILAPTTPFQAPSLGDGYDGNNSLLPDSAAAYTAAANLAGLPAMTFPLPARSADKLPTAALHFTAKAWNETLLLQTAQLLENSN
jgi:aspartyl-tRNA(Asn)/glutamyl-tRNA(Gln) amidotransferase subunit A